MIFHDSVLREIAAVRPETAEELGQIKGVGASKLDRYGRFVLGVLAAPAPDGLGRRAQGDLSGSFTARWTNGVKAVS